MEWKCEGLVPLSNFQKKVWIDTLSSLNHERICYRDIIEIFRWIGVDIFSKDELTRVIEKGGNAFLNHLMHCLIYTREWSEDSKEVLHVQDLALKLNSCFSPQFFRYVWIGVRKEAKNKRVYVLSRGKGWHTNPLDARDDGLASKSNISIPFYSSNIHVTLMLESSCPCMIFIEEKDRFYSRVEPCNCEKMWERNKTLSHVSLPNTTDMEDMDMEDKIGYDEVDQAQIVSEHDELDEGCVVTMNPSDCEETLTQENCVVIDGIKISRCDVNGNNELKYGYMIEHSDVHFSSNHKDILLAYKNYLMS